MTEGDTAAEATSPELHRMIAEEAAKQGVSMSQWVSEAVAIKVGVRQAFKALKDWVDGRRGDTELEARLSETDSRPRGLVE